jgi:tetratricopeptide (TPR) repeat protein
MEDGEPSSAYALFEQALDIRTRLTQLDPASHLYRIERSIATVRLGDAARSLRRHDEAERLYLHAMVLDEQLYRERPGMPRAVTLLAWSCDRLASYAGGRREWDRSEALYAKCLALMQRLCAIENSADAHRGLCTAHIHVGDTAKRHGDEEAYRDHVEHALEQAEIAASLSPNDRLARWGLLSVRCTYLDSRRPLISPTDAASYASQTLAQARELAGLDAADFTMHSVLTRAQVAAAECAEVSGNIRTAMELRDEHVRTCRQIHELHPDDEEAEHGLQDAIAAQSELIKRLRLDGGF